MANVPAAHPRGVAGADQGADRGAGDSDRFYVHLVERFDDGDVGETARASGAQREREAFHPVAAHHVAPACRANSQAFAASGRTNVALAAANVLVAVPSRTRPTIP